MRWDKNFLTLLHLTLARRRGSADLRRRPFRRHAADRGRLDVGLRPRGDCDRRRTPTVIDMKNNLIRGVRKASDFLMALQLTGAFKRDALPNLQVRAAGRRDRRRPDRDRHRDGADGVLPVQVEKTLQQYETLAAEIGEARVRARLRRGGARAARRVSGARPGGPRGARTRRGGRRGTRLHPARASLGRRHHRLSQAACSIRPPTA